MGLAWGLHDNQGRYTIGTRPGDSGICEVMMTSIRAFMLWLTETPTIWAGAAVEQARTQFGLSEKQARNVLTRLVRGGAMTTDGHGNYTWN